MTDDNGDNYKYGNDDAWSVGKCSFMNVVCSSKLNVLKMQVKFVPIDMLVNNEMSQQ